MKSAIRKILIVDDDEGSLNLLSQIIKDIGCEFIKARDGVEALEVIRRSEVDLVISDINMPRLDGLGLCEKVKTDNDTNLIPFVLVTGLNDTDSRIAGLSHGADDFFTKPFEPDVLSVRIRSLLKHKFLIDELENIETVIHSFAMMVEARDSYTAGHCNRLSRYAMELGKVLSLSENEIRFLGIGGTVHDIGKIGVSDSILLKPGKLSPDERVLIEKHPVIGHRLCEPLRSIKEIFPMVRHHHEKWNGTGYPDGLKGENIPLSARIMAVVDVFDALSTKRSYKPAFGLEESLRILSEEVEKQCWDPYVVRKFSELVRSKGKGF